MFQFCIGLAALALVLAVSAEPPVGNYLPPGQGSFAAPSQNYGAPQKLSSQYGAPSGQFSAPSSQYGAPNGGYKLVH